MKTLDYYMGLNYKIEIVKDQTEGGYVLSVPELKGCLTCADNLEKGMELIKDAKKQWLMAALESKYQIMEPNALEDYSGQFKLRLPKSLHKDLAEKSKQEGISMNQYCLYLLSKNSSLPAENR
ncbi:MAG: toxin-antitoxin system HicB family antitoxin [Firmicutes bacterium HGW-Firmicutes-12]|nr:MAG: toxin-antitoxin system HicB family antitoxin [Firmicutes bacterium HGW-Firmicutes-12]